MGYLYADILAALTVWRLTLLIVVEDGPFDIFNKIRDVAGVTYDEIGNPAGNNVLSKALICTWCISMWVALCIVAWYGFDLPFLRICSYSAITILLNNRRMITNG